MTLRATASGEALANVRGGRETDDAGRFLGLLDVVLTLDSGELGAWEGGRLRAWFQTLHGAGLSGQAVGAFQCVSNIEAPRHVTQLSELTLRQAWCDDRLWVLAGKHDGNDHFAASAQGAAFLHSSAGLPPSIPIPTYPEQDWGLVGNASWPGRGGLRLGLYQGEPDGGRSLRASFARLRGPFAVAQATVEYELLERAGALQLGGWYSGDRFPALDEPVRGARRGSYGGYAVLDQWLWRPAAPADQEGVGLFAQYAWAPPERSEAEHYVGGGLRWTGPLPGRPRDALGVAAYHVRFGRFAGRARRGETALELLARAQLAGWLALTLDAQLVHHPDGREGREAVVLGARVVLSL